MKQINMTQDLNRGISSIDYNALNLPKAIHYSDYSSIGNTYTAEGEKLFRLTLINNNGWPTPIGNLTPPNMTSYVTQYCGNMVYNFQSGQQTSELLLVDGGYITFEGSTPKYHFYVQDHLGNNRLVMSQTGQVEQEAQYYPSGAIMTDISTSLSLQPYLYSGKELDRMHGLDWYDFGARHYDAALLRWHSMDPLCEKYYHISPYVFCGNNFVNAVDIAGKAWKLTTNMNTGQYTGYKWVDSKNAYENGNLKPGLYEQAIFFTNQGMDGKTFNPSNDYNMGSSTAYVYTKDGNILTFNASTYPSDINQYATVPEGIYEGQLGIHHGSVQSYPAIRVSDVGTEDFSRNSINLGHPNPSNPKKNTADGINIHKPGRNNLTGKTKSGKAISEGCLLIDQNQWKEFISLFPESSSISITVSRSLSTPTNKTVLINNLKEYEKNK